MESPPPLGFVPPSFEDGSREVREESVSFEKDVAFLVNKSVETRFSTRSTHGCYLLLKDRKERKEGEGRSKANRLLEFNFPSLLFFPSDPRII